MAELKVKEILNQRGISVPEFAEMIGVTREYCYSLVSGKHASQKSIEKMAKILNLPIRSLYECPAPLLSEYNPYEIVFGRTEHYQPNDIRLICSRCNRPFSILCRVWLNRLTH